MSACVAAESFKTIYDKTFSVGAPKHLSPRWQVAHQEQRSPRASVRTAGVRMAAEPQGSVHIVCCDRGHLSWLQLPASPLEDHEDDVAAAAVKRSAWPLRSEPSTSCFSEPPASGGARKSELLLLLQSSKLRCNESQTNHSGLPTLLSKMNGKIKRPYKASVTREVLNHLNPLSQYRVARSNQKIHELQRGCV